MAKLRQTSQEETSKHVKDVRSLFGILAKQDVSGETVFSADKNAILKVFRDTNDTNKNDILVRLTLIDSMYSTQMGRRYYALEELADVLAKLANGKKGELKKLFLAFANDPEKNAHQFDFHEGMGENMIKKNLFSENYGIGKDGEDKGVAISLISKYAYFLTEFKFPIYDSIACEMYPLVWHFCGFKGKCPKLRVTKNGRVQGKQSMILFVNAINLLIKKLDCKVVNYDLLDRFLWFVGKIRRGNLSLVLTRKEYEETMRLYPAQSVTTTSKNGKKKTETEYFNIERVDIEKLEYLKNRETLKAFFELAKYYGNKK